ncbi:MAG: ribonuclease P protein component [Patescibacteria group bacterium]
MLPKLFRLNKETDIRRVLRRGAERSSPILALKFLNSGFRQSRFGFLVSKKVSLRAVKRNLVKRRLRNIVGQTIPSIFPGYDCLLIARPRILGESFEVLERQTITLFKTANLLNSVKTKKGL